MASDAAARFGLGEIGGVGMEIELHIGGVVSEAGIGMGCEVSSHIILSVAGCFSGFGLFGRDGADSKECSRVDCSRIVEHSRA